MRAIIQMQLPSYLKSTYKPLIIIFTTIIPSFSLHAGGLSVNGGIGFHNIIEGEKVSEKLSNNVYIGAQFPITEALAVSLDGFSKVRKNDHDYLGMAVDYKIKISSDFELSGRLGTDFFDDSINPKIGFEVARHINDNLDLTMATIASRTTSEPQYQFLTGVRYTFSDDSKRNEESDQISSSEVYSDNQKIIGTVINKKEKISPQRVTDFKEKRYYRVIKGDSLWSISQKLNISFKKLIEANQDKVINPNLIYPDQLLSY